MPTSNWFGTFSILVRTLEDIEDKRTASKRRVVDRTMYAAKMWREIVALSGNCLTLKDALVYIQRIRTLNAPMPMGNEYPDLPEARLAYYSGAPWKGEQKDDGARTREVLRRDLRNGLRRILYPIHLDKTQRPSEPMSDVGVRMTLARTEKFVDQIPEGEYAVTLLRQELARRNSPISQERKGRS